jgi:excisionase family DNA binding protein
MITNSNTIEKSPLPPLIKVREAAKLLSISRASVHALIESGDLAASKVSPTTKKEREHVRITRKSLCGFYRKRFGHSLNLALENPFEA